MFTPSRVVATPDDALKAAPGFHSNAAHAQLLHFTALPLQELPAGRLARHAGQRRRHRSSSDDPTSSRAREHR